MRGRAAERERRIEKADRLLRYSPFDDRSVWGKVCAVFTGVGGAGVATGLIELLAKRFSWWLTAGLVPLLVVVALFAVDRFVERRRNTLIMSAEQCYPTNVDTDWRSTSLQRYRDILVTCLVSAIRIQKKWYPDCPVSCDPDDDQVSSELYKIVDRHMAFHPPDSSRPSTSRVHTDSASNVQKQED